VKRNDDIFHILDQIKVSIGYRSESGIAIFVWRLTWYYGYNHFKERFICL